jgi:GTP cyclohydrolase II
MSPAIQLRPIAEADFPTRFGHFRVYGFQGCVSPAPHPFSPAPPPFSPARQGGVSEQRPGDASPTSEEEAIALKMGDLAGDEPPLVRIHSQCLTGDVFHSLRCDCRAQLELALESIAREGRGLLIYENQEGRGIGLLNKLRAYELQDRGADTVEANRQLGFEADLRGYGLSAAILQHFGVKAVRLMSNNPEKIRALERAGIRVAERVSAAVPVTPSNDDYLRTKREKMGHLD